MVCVVLLFKEGNRLFLSHLLASIVSGFLLRLLFLRLPTICTTPLIISDSFNEITFADGVKLVQLLAVFSFCIIFLVFLVLNVNPFH